MGRSPSRCNRSQTQFKKGPWTPEEDEILIEYMNKHGTCKWTALPKLAGLNRCGKSCILCWTNYLRPDIKRGKFSQHEEETILNLQAILGNKWLAIATQLPDRTDNKIKNFWNTHLKKKLIQMGLDPTTHNPIPLTQSQNAAAMHYYNLNFPSIDMSCYLPTDVGSYFYAPPTTNDAQLLDQFLSLMKLLNWSLTYCNYM